MLLKSPLDILEHKLKTISKQCYEQEGRVQKTLQDDDAAILTLLRDGISSVRTLMDSRVLLLGDKVQTVRSKSTLITTTTTMLAQRCEEISTTFTKLAELADRYLQDIMDAQLEVIEFEGELAKLQQNLTEAKTTILASISTAKGTLKSKEVELNHAISQLAVVTADMDTLSEKLRKNRDRRHILRAVSYSADLNASQECLNPVSRGEPSRGAPPYFFRL